MRVAVVKESFPGERRVALIPANVPQIIQAGGEVIVQAGAGAAAGFADGQYADKGAQIVSSRGEALGADVLLQVRALGANREAGQEDLPQMRPGQIVIGMCDPLGAPEAAEQFAQTGAALLALELIPRITRAQTMDVLSSQAMIAGYRAVLLAAAELPKMFPMMMTAAGTLSPARVFVVGAGVAGLQAIATARRLGGVVQAYDVRPACREQVESVGGRFVLLELEAAESEDAGGYAKAMGEAFYEQQRRLMTSVVGQSDVVVTTAAIPGQPAPVLITAEAVAGMGPGSVIVDLAAERGGNCEPSKPDERVVEDGVIILGPTNLPSEVPNHASQMFSNNITRFLLNLITEGEVHLDLEDEIIRETLVARDGQVVHASVRELLGREAVRPAQAAAQEAPGTDAGQGPPPPGPEPGDQPAEGTGEQTEPAAGDAES